MALGTNAVRVAAASAGGIVGSLSQSQLGNLGEKLVNSQFSQRRKQKPMIILTIFCANAASARQVLPPALKNWQNWKKVAKAQCLTTILHPPNAPSIATSRRPSERTSPRAPIFSIIRTAVSQETRAGVPAAANAGGNQHFARRPRRANQRVDMGLLTARSRKRACRETTTGKGLVNVCWMNLRRNHRSFVILRRVTRPRPTEMDGISAIQRLTSGSLIHRGELRGTPNCGLRRRQRFHGHWRYLSPAH